MDKNKAVFFATSKMVSYQKETSNGTGTSFFAKYRDNMFLITTAHQLDQVSHVRILLLSESKKNPQKEVITIKRSEFTINSKEDYAWVDASMYLSELLKQKKKLELRAFSLEAVDIEAINFMDDVYFVGYPTGLIDKENLTPLMRRCSFATLYENDFGGEPFFVIDGSVFPGSSGSPVFQVSDHIKLLGIISSSYLTNSGTKQQFVNLGRVIKIDRVLESIQQVYG